MAAIVALHPSAAGDEPVPERSVLDRWQLLSSGGLLAARRAGKIAWIKGKRGSVWYRPSAVRDYIAAYLENPCHDRAQDHCSSSTDNGSLPSMEAGTSTGSGLTPELQEHVERVLAQSI